jgi:BirA family biotin operon repressor/biotin-[acetyl-CoA-carboxylase] ligase
LDRDYARLTSGHFAAVADEWESHCTTIGRPVVIRNGDRAVRGRAESLDEDGALLLRTEHGHLERVVGGDVTMSIQAGQ